ncbi:hypothetical protein, partial [Corallococcus sp. AB049A]|uniref:hypothetical protein n=1 Tax=Corallococcus sp. AB049A TaxID=2316721 RepID=UPI001F1F30AA
MEQLSNPLGAGRTFINRWPGLADQQEVPRAGLITMDPGQYVGQLGQHVLEGLVQRFYTGECVHLRQLAGVHPRQHLVRMLEAEAPRDPKLKPALRPARQFFSAASIAASPKALSFCAAR